MKYLTPIPKQFVDQSGIPYSNGTVSVYLSGSDELADIFEDAEGDALCPNPCRLDSNGAWQCFVAGDVPLDYIVENAEGNVVDSYFGVVISGGGTGDVTKAYVDTQDRALGARIDNLDQDLADEADRAEAAEKAAKTEVVGGENVTVEETIAPDGHSIFEVSSDGAPQQQSNWTQQDPSEPDYIKNKPTKLSDFTDDITKQSLVESGIGIEKPVSSAAVNAGLSEKADKVSNATAGNFATLDANGNLTDSGKNSADFATAEQGAKADSAVQGVKVNGTELSKDGNNVVDVPVPTASTETPLKDGTASAGSSSQWARGDHRHPTDDSREAVANKVQSIDDESETDYPSSKAVADFVNSSVATNTATFLGNFSLADLGLTYPATEVQIAAALNSHTWPTGYPTNNDYVYVEIRNPQSTIDDKVQRYKYRDGLASWSYEYTLNNSSFTAEEKSAIDSGITSQDVTNLRADHTTLGTHVANTSNPHNVTAAQVGAEPAFSVLPIDKGGTGKTTGKAATNNLFSDINNVNTDPDDTARIVFKYGSPSDSNGIFFARSILSLWNYIKSKISSVLGLSEEGYTGNAATATSASNYASGGDIDTALQGKYVKPSGGIPKTDLASGVQTSLGKADTAYQKPNGGIPDSDIASASTWNGKQDALPTTGTASTTYAINVSGKAATAGTADSANSVAWSNVSGKPTVDQNFSTPSSTNAISTAAVYNRYYKANTSVGSNVLRLCRIKPSNVADYRQIMKIRVFWSYSSAVNYPIINAEFLVKFINSITPSQIAYDIFEVSGNSNAFKFGYVVDSTSGHVDFLMSYGSSYVINLTGRAIVEVEGSDDNNGIDFTAPHIGNSMPSYTYSIDILKKTIVSTSSTVGLLKNDGSVDTNSYALTSAIPTVDQTYDATSTNAQAGTAVAQAVSGKLDGAVRLTSSDNIDNINGQTDNDRWFILQSSSFAGGTYPSGVSADNYILHCFGNNNRQYQELYIYDNTNKPSAVWIRKTNGGSPGSYVFTSWVNEKDASWINSGTFDAARIPTSLPGVTVGYANQVNVSYPLTGNAYFAVVSTNTAGNKVIYTAKNISAWQDDNNGALITIGLSGGEKNLARSGHLRLGNGAYTGYLRVDNLTANRTIQMPDAAGTLALQNGSYSNMSVGNANIANGLKTYIVYGTVGWRRYLSIDLSQYADASLYWGYTIVFDLYSDGYKSNRAYLGRLTVEIGNWGTLTNKIPSRCLLNWTTKAYINDTTFRPNLVVSQGKIELYIYHSVNNDYYVHIGKIQSSYNWMPSTITVDESPNSQYYNDTDYATYTSGKTIYTAGLASYLVGYAQNLTPGGTSGQYLKSNGANSDPSWANTSDMTVGTADVAKRLTSYYKENAGSSDNIYRVGGITTTDTDLSGSGVLLLFECRDNSRSKTGKGIILLKRGEYSSDAVSAEFIWLQRHSSTASSDIDLYYVPISGSNSKVDLYVKCSGYGRFRVSLFGNLLLSTWTFESVSIGGLSSLPSGAVAISMANHYVSTTWGTIGQYLKSNGANNAPSWENVTTLSPTAAVANFDNFNGTVNTTNVVNSNAGSASTNAPKNDSRTFHVITTIGSGTNSKTQLAIGIDENRNAGLFYRCMAAGSWQPWMQVLNERPVSMEKGSEYKGIHIDSNGHPVACLYGLSIGTAVSDSSILTVL